MVPNPRLRRSASRVRDRVPFVFAYHEIVRTPSSGFDGGRCDVYYQGRLSPDFYGWVFPHGATASVGMRHRPERLFAAPGGRLPASDGGPGRDGDHPS